MNFSQNVRSILDELNEVLYNVSEEQANELFHAVTTAKRVFVAGAGRSLLMVRCFAMRLMQTGFQAFVVGETTTPAITSEDLLIIASGSGETGTLKVNAASARKTGAKISLITSNPDSSISQLSDQIVVIPASTPKANAHGSDKIVSIQPGASAFEQSVLLLCDALIIDLGSTKNLKERNSSLMKLHANLE